MAECMRCMRRERNEVYTLSMCFMHCIDGYMAGMTVKNKQVTTLWWHSIQWLYRFHKVKNPFGEEKACHLGVRLRGHGGTTFTMFNIVAPKRLSLEDAKTWNCLPYSVYAYKNGEPLPFIWHDLVDSLYSSPCQDKCTTIATSLCPCPIVIPHSIRWI